MTGVLRKRVEVLVRDRPNLRAVIGGQHELVALPDALQRALALVNFPSVVSTALAVADHSGPRLFRAKARPGANPADPRNPGDRNRESKHLFLHPFHLCIRALIPSTDLY